MLDFRRNLLGSQAEVVPTGDPADRYTGTGNAGASFTDLGIGFNELADIDSAGHAFRLLLRLYGGRLLDSGNRPLTK